MEAENIPVSTVSVSPISADDAHPLRSTRWPEVQASATEKPRLTRTACFACGASCSPAVTATLDDRRTIALCSSCLLVPVHVTTFVGAFLANRRAAALAEGYAVCASPSPYQAVASCGRLSR